MNVALLFPGYGSQHVGMGKDLYESFPVAKKVFEEASDHMGIDFRALCFTEAPADMCVSSSSSGSFCFQTGTAPINSINKAYLALFVIGHAIDSIVKSEGIKPLCVAGYDTGHYSAIQAANGMSFSQGLDLLEQYAHFYMDLLKGGGYDLIKVTGLTSTQLPKFLDNRTSIAAFQARSQHLVSGTKDGIAALKEKLRNASGVLIYDERVGLGLNSELMEPVVTQYRPLVERMTYSDLSMPLLSNINGIELIKAADIKQELIDSITRPVKWDTVVDKLAQADVIVGIGHKANLLDLVTEKYPDKHCIALCKAEDMKKIQELYRS